MVGKRKIDSLRANIAKMAKAAEADNGQEFQQACKEIPNLLDLDQKDPDRLLGDGLSSQEQGPAGRDFQLSGISGSGIAKNFGFGSGIGYICQKKLSIGYFRVLKILIGYFRVHPNIAQFLYDMLIYVTDFSHFLKKRCTISS